MNKTEKMVSIVLPVYNGETYLRKSIDSVISQTYTNWELLILDDCSVDETPTISKEYAAEDSRISYIRNEKNLKLPGNLNKGFALSKGEYLTWTSDDNMFHPDAIEKMVNVLESSPNAELVYASYNVIDENDNFKFKRIVYPKAKNTIVGFNCVGACFLYSRKVYEKIGDYDTGLFLVEDFDYWQRVVANFESVGIEDILYEYREHSANLTNTMKKERFYTAYKNMLIKNISIFGKLNLEQKYNFYSALYNCEENVPSDATKEIKRKKQKYYFIHYWTHLLPRKIHRKIKKNSKN